jgi:hypothetical protein
VLEFLKGGAQAVHARSYVSSVESPTNFAAVVKKSGSAAW